MFRSNGPESIWPGRFIMGVLGMLSFSRVAGAVAALLLALGLGAAAQASGVSKASYAANAQNPLLQLVSDKPCCYSYRTGTYQRFSPKTCYRVEGRIVDDRYCGGGNYYDRRQPNYNPYYQPNHQPYVAPRPRHNWNPQYQQGGSLCCKRGRKEWWVSSHHECAQRRNGQLVHPSYCYKN
jgi:hypothetical protein